MFEAFKSKAKGVVKVANPYLWLQDLESLDTQVRCCDFIFF